jgi:ribose transport system permease protein
MSEAEAPRTSRAAPLPLRGARAALDFVGVTNVSLLLALGALVAIIGYQNRNFFLWQNIEVIGTSVTLVGLLAVAQTVVIICGALDISVGSMTGLASVASAMVFTSTSSPWLGIGAALGLGLLCGLVNGIVIVYGRVNPVVATLATLAAFKGVAQLISNGRAQGYTGADSIFNWLARGKILHIPSLIWLVAVVAVAMHLLLKYSDLGRNIYAIGGNDRAARLAGINLNRYLIGVYMLTGFVAGIAGVVLTARTGSGQPVSGSEGLELQSITAAALGGAALAGGKGAISSTVLAVVILGTLTNGLTILGVNPFWQNVATGAVLVTAVVIQQQRSGERRVGLPR